MNPSHQISFSHWLPSLHLTLRGSQADYNDLKICQYVRPLPNPRFPFHPPPRNHNSKSAPGSSPLRCSGPAGRVGFRRGGGQAPERRLREPCPVQRQRRAGPQQSQKRLQIRTREPPFFTPARYIKLCFEKFEYFLLFLEILKKFFDLRQFSGISRNSGKVL